MTNEEILKEQVQMLKELIRMKDELIGELNGKIARLQSKSKIIQDLTDIPVISIPSVWTPSVGPYAETTITTTKHSDGDSFEITPFGMTQINPLPGRGK